MVYSPRAVLIATVVASAASAIAIPVGVDNGALMTRETHELIARNEGFDALTIRDLLLNKRKVPRRSLAKRSPKRTSTVVRRSPKKGGDEDGEDKDGPPASGIGKMAANMADAALGN